MESTPLQICDPISTSRLKPLSLCPNPMGPWHPSNPVSLEPTCATSASLSPNPWRSRASHYTHVHDYILHTPSKIKVKIKVSLLQPPNNRMFHLLLISVQAMACLDWNVTVTESSCGEFQRGKRSRCSFTESREMHGSSRLRSLLHGL